MSARVAFLGLGTMGAPMASHLARAGHRVAVYNRTAAKAERLARELGVRAAASPAKAAEGSEFVAWLTSFASCPLPATSA